MKCSYWSIGLFVVTLICAILSITRYVNAKNTAKYILYKDIANLRPNFRAEIEQREADFFYNYATKKLGFTDYNIENITFRNGCQDADVIVQYYSRKKSSRFKVSYCYTALTNKDELMPMVAGGDDMTDLATGKQYSRTMITLFSN
jgi:hypothetical protein